MLRSQSERFVQTLAEKSALQPLYKNKDIILQLKSEKESVLMSFHNGVCSLISEPSGNIDVNITGKYDSLVLLIDGSERLMMLEQEGNLEVEGKQCNLLTLESLFILAGESSYLFRHMT
ncbi:SCP-2 sterol transfer family protein [Scopulibacillus darangshiensis]|uniref:SCP-2 sterol transfer family protein n=1 Tax=Scopulibacillus darangshiensis TaxID=442528 RepID=A0A4R2NQ55_9BACL|nr:SCP2 sterol-binding domain-containing protein [Scopulibacillus darangshiensis]TCP23504.1 SCP-2 sterol transfer family protein [Scopulibacillus darangshiensis]